MRVVYKKTIVDKIIDAQAEARGNGKEIEFIYLTAAEGKELLREVEKTIPVITTETRLSIRDFRKAVNGEVTKGRFQFHGVEIRVGHARHGDGL